jgi:hypothetical protein
MNALVRNSPLIVLASAALAAPAAAASDEAARTLVLSASVTSFCQVQQGSGEVELNNGEASFGPITEVCNSAGGYRVLASFVNLDSATVVTSDGSAPLADDGTVAFVRPSARKIVQSWALRDAVKRDPAAPVFVQVNVSPL